jgi:pilus assembly protein CpaB
MNRRALVISLVVGILGLCLMLLYQHRFELEAAGGEKVKLLVVVKRVDRGKPILDDALGTREVPMAYVDERSIRESDKSRVLGLRVGTTIRENQLLMWTDLATASDDRKDLSSLVLPGYRAASIRVGANDGSLSLVRPGDYVDVIGVLGGGDGPRSSVVLLQRVLVLASGSDTSPDAVDNRNTRFSELTLTLSVTLQEAQLLTLASEKGRLSVAVRHPDDQQRSAKAPDISSDSLLRPEQRTGIVRGGPALPVNITAPPNP